MADRVGVETKNGTTVHYRGTSCALLINPIKLYHYLDKKMEGFIQAEMHV